MTGRKLQSITHPKPNCCKTASRMRNQTKERGRRATNVLAVTSKQRRPKLRSAATVIGRAAQMIAVLLVCRLELRRASWPSLAVQAVNVQRLQVPDLVVIDQLQQQQQHHQQHRPLPLHLLADNATRLGGSLWPQTASLRDSGPQAASLVDVNQPAEGHQQQITFECLISFDRKRDKNLIVKWHHDERNEPIYQWIPELQKRTIAPQYRAFIEPITASQSPEVTQGEPGATGNQTQLLEAGFRLMRPTKDLGGKYTCSAISSQNDDSKSKKMIVYTPPKSFRFNATRADIGALLASQRDRLIQMTQPAQQHTPGQLPYAYRMRSPEQAPPQPAIGTTISPQMYSTIDYVNVNQQRMRQQQQQQQQPAQQFRAPLQLQQLHQQVGRNSNLSRAPARQQLGLKLVCDIDQVFPVPEVSIYRLAKLDGSHPEKLAKLETRIERDGHSGLFHVQVTSILDDDELQAAAKQVAGAQEAGNGAAEVYFECLIALTNLELSRYADNKRSIIYRPGQQLASGLQVGAHYQQDSAELRSPGGVGWGWLFKSSAARQCTGAQVTLVVSLGSAAATLLLARDAAAVARSLIVHL